MSRAFRNGVYGQVLRRGGRLELATRALQEAVALNERAWELSPRDEGAVVQSGMSLHAELALAYVQAQRPIEALAILERGTSRALRERLVGHDTSLYDRHPGSDIHPAKATQHDWKKAMQQVLHTPDAPSSIEFALAT